MTPQISMRHGSGTPNTNPDHPLSKQQPAQECQQQKHPLTPRELEITLLRAQGLEYREIAARLGTSKNTVTAQIGRIHKKLEVRNSSELTRWAMKNYPEIFA